MRRFELPKSALKELTSEALSTQEKLDALDKILADQGISMDSVEKVKASVDPKLVQVFVYPGAGHAFNRSGTTSWHEPSAKLARERTVAFLKEKLG